MSARVMAIVVSTCCLVACGSSGSSGLPHTSADVSICAALARALDNRSGLQQLAGLVFESGAPVSHRLRQEIATYVADVAEPGSASAHQAAVTAENDCRSIGAPVSKAYGGAG